MRAATWSQSVAPGEAGHDGKAAQTRSTTVEPNTRRVRRPPIGDHACMSLSPAELEEFKKRYEHAFNIKLSDGEALDLADRLEELYRIVLDRSTAQDELPRAPNPPWRPEPNPDAGKNA